MTRPRTIATRSGFTVALGLALLLWSPAAHAQSPSPQTQNPANSQAARDAEAQAAYRAGLAAGTKGPASVTLLDQASLALPDDIIFIPKAEATRILRAFGNTVSEGTFQGLIAGLKPTDGWFVVVRYIKEGYIKDDEAKNWNADELLQNLKDGNEEANKDRVARGFPEIEAVGWVEKPNYDPDTHRLVWSLLTKHKGAPDTGAKGINYNTYALGRDGYFSLNLLTNTDRINSDKAVARTLLAALDYNSGKRYEDFNASTDHIAAYGIAALVGGIAAKKLGLLALAGAFILKFAKIIAIGVAAFFGGIWKLFSRKRSQA
jgi:uncharacterized membrane-anchored protein